MEHESLDGFITRKQACDQFDISDRSIGRYLKKAIQKQDHEFLKQFRLATIDNEVLIGPHVSFDVIDRLQAEGRVPTWYVSLVWMQRKFAVRGEAASGEAVDAAAAESASQTSVEQRDVVESRGSQDEIIQLLKEQLAGLQDDKRKWEEEKREIREDARETRKLMNQMQQLMGHLQDRLLPERTTQNATSPVEATAEAEFVDAEDPTPQKEERGTRRTRSAGPRPVSRKGTRTSTDTKRRTAKKATTTSIWQRDVKELLSLRRK